MFQFQAKALGGKLIRGEIDASTDTEARVKLRAQQLIPIKVVAKGERKITAAGFSSTKVKSKDLQIFTRQFATLINSGIPVVQSLQILAGSSSSHVLKVALNKVKADIESGKRLGDCLEPHSNVFDNLYVNLVKAGEEGGVLDTILNRLASYIEKSVKIRNKVQGALFYPAAILFVAAIVIFAIMTFVIPKFKELFTGSGQKLPALTQFVVNMSEFFVSYWYLIIGGTVGLALFVKQWFGTKEGQQTFDTYIIGVPIFGTLIQKASIARFTRTLSTMLSSGVSIIDALDISAKVCGNYLIEKSLMGAKKSISEGKSIVTPLATNKYIPEMVVQMIGVGEQTGALDTMCSKIADFYEEEVDYAVTALTSILEPLMMVFLGGIIAFLVIAMYLPIFNMASTMGG
jgi:type IV pilus assembly protein PilC